MKINVEVEMTPEEARRLMGLPDLSALQAEMLEEMRRRMKGGMEALDPQALLRAWMPSGAQGIEEFQKFLWDSAARATGQPEKVGKKE
jgi:hypothetical protein